MKRIDIEELLRWAYQRELPKAQTAPAGPDGFGEAWGKTRRFGQLLANIDGHAPMNGYGVVIDFSAFDGPHQDALAIGAAVAKLDGLELGIPDDWSPLADLGDLGDLGSACVARAMQRFHAVDGKGKRRLRLSVRGLVERHAKLGSRPVWEADRPIVDFERDAYSGRPLWFVRTVQMVEGAFGDIPQEIETPVRRDDRMHRVPAGAYQKRRLEPDPTDAVIARAEWELWRAALDILVEDLAGVLVARIAVASALPARPWENRIVESASKIIPDLSQSIDAAMVSSARGRTKTRKTAAAI